MTNFRKSSYHHGNLRNALLSAALEVVREEGVGAISLREVARRAGVSHAAPAHHFGDKAGLLTALATQGYELFGAALRDGAARAQGDPKLRLSWVGWAYVMLAAQHRQRFEIMFRPELLHQADAELVEASSTAYLELTKMVRSFRRMRVSRSERCSPFELGPRSTGSRRCGCTATCPSTQRLTPWRRW